MYSLSEPVRCCASRVACPSTSGSTPDARGSSVPVCPIRLSPRDRRATTTASCELGPTGLLMTRTPSIVLWPVQPCVARSRKSFGGLHALHELANDDLLQGGEFTSQR